MYLPRIRLHRLLQHAALLLAGCLLLGASAFADPPGRVGRIADFTGNIWFYDAEQGEWTQAVRNRPLTTGDRLSTDRGARAELQIGSTMLRLDGGSDVELQQIEDERLRVQLNAGSLALRLRSQDVLNEVEVITAEGRFTPLRTGHYRIDRRDDSSFGAAWSGELRFESSDSTLVVAAGQRAEFWQEGAGRTTHYTWSALENDPFSQWAAAEDRRDDYRSAQRYVSPEMTGADDLDRYGRWDSHPEYGSLWIPYRVAPGWAPYRMGQWAWVRPWGWTWVDDAPWGFAPFHYGRWVSWRGSWCWAPGSYVARPVYSPALVAWIGGGNVSVGISIGSPGYVGWVPLGPREYWVPYYQVSPRYVRNVNIGHVQDQRGRRPPPEPIMYTNRGVPGGVTVVPSNVLRERQPVSNAVTRVDPNVTRRVLAEQLINHQAPPAPVVRTVVAPNAVVPPSPRFGGRPNEEWQPRRGVEPQQREAQQPAPVVRPVPAPQAVRPPQAVAPVPRSAPEAAVAPPPRFSGRPNEEWQPRRGVEPRQREAPPPAPVVRAVPPQAAPAARAAPSPAPQAVAPHPPAAVPHPPIKQFPPAAAPQPPVQQEPPAVQQRRGRDEPESDGRGQRQGRDDPPGHQRRGQNQNLN